MYELEAAVLTFSYPLGVSNELIGKKSSVSVGNGKLLIVCPVEAKAAAAALD